MDPAIGTLRIVGRFVVDPWRGRLGPRDPISPEARVLVGDRLYSVRVAFGGGPVRAGAIVARFGPQEAGRRRTDARERDRRWRDRHPEAWRAYHRRKVARWRARHWEAARAIERRSDARRRARR